ncbi:MAG: BamA/TamA family outer membrane protein, partial [Planctomycetota bacterium]
MHRPSALRIGSACLAAAVWTAGCATGPAADPAWDTPLPPSRAATAAVASPAAPGRADSTEDYQAELEALADRCSIHLDQDITVLDEARIRRAALDTLADIARTTDEEDIPNRAEDLRFRLLDEYRDDGYHFADVDVKIGPPRNKGSRRIDIAAVERDRVMVDAIEITGARAIDPGELRDYYNDHATTPVKLFGRPVYNARVAEEAARRMQERYEFEGYPDASARVVETRFNRRRNAVVIRYAVGEGPRAWLQTVRWRALDSRRGSAPESGAAAPPALRLRPWEIRDQLRAAGVVEGAPYSPALAGAARSALAAYYSEEGFPFALVQAVETERRRDRNGDWQVTLELLILENDIAGICRIGIRGNHWTAGHVIRREVAQLQGTTYTGSSVRAMQQALTGLGLFKTVQVRRAAHKVWHEELPSEPGRSGRIVVEREIPDDLGAGNPETLRAAPTIDFPNFTSAGHSAQLRAVLSTLRQRIEGKLTAPWTFGVPVRTRVDLSWEDRPEPLKRKPSFRAEEARAAVTFSRPIIGELRGFLGYETASTRVFDASNAFLSQTSIGT